MKRKHLLLLTFLLSQSTPLWGMDPEVQKLDHSIQKAIKKVHQNPDYNRNATKVILVGDTGRGKTTLLHYLAGKNLDVKQVPNSTKYFLDVDPQNLLNGSTGPARTINSRTLFPSSWYDQPNNVVYWDCTGFKDSRGHVQEIANAFAIHQLFKSPTRVKVVVVAEENDADGGRGEVFLNLLKRISEVLPNSAQLNPPSQGISLVITKQRTDPSGLLQNIADELDNSNPPHQFRTGAVRDLVELLKSNNRNAALPEPTGLGAYPVTHRTGILASINAVQPIDNPRVNLVVSANARILARNYAQTLNDKIVNLIRRVGSQAVVSYCNTQIDNHTGSVRDLRTTLRTMEGYLDGFKTGLLGLPNIQGNNLTAYLNTIFTQNIMALPPAASLRRMIEALSFLKTIENTIQYNAGAWAQSWSTVIDKVRSLTALDTNVTNGVLKIKGALIGTSDLNAIQRPFTHADIFAFNTIIVDENVTHPGLLLNLIAPSWKVDGSKTINISGLAGHPGADGSGAGVDGSPGRAGGNGGPFYGKGEDFYQVNLLTVHTHGGSGGAGGHGARGSDGANGRDGDLSVRTPSGNTYYYQDPGTDGQSGGNGGQGGHGGAGGYKGYSVIDGYNAWTSTSSNGAVGAHGSAGLGGTGGVHGRHCQGTHVTGRTTQEQYPTIRWITGRTEQQPYQVPRDFDSEMYSKWDSLSDDARCALYPDLASEIRWGSKVMSIFTKGKVEARLRKDIRRNPTRTEYGTVNLPDLPVADTIWKTVYLPDVWQVPQGYQAPRGSAPNGLQPTALNTHGQQNPPAQTPLNTGNILPAYRTYYQQALTNPVTAGFVKDFPNL